MRLIIGLDFVRRFIRNEMDLETFLNEVYSVLPRILPPKPATSDPEQLVRYGLAVATVLADHRDEVGRSRFERGVKSANASFRANAAKTDDPVRRPRDELIVELYDQAMEYRSKVDKYRFVRKTIVRHKDPNGQPYTRPSDSTIKRALKASEKK